MKSYTCKERGWEAFITLNKSLFFFFNRLQYFFPNEIEWALCCVDKGLVSMVVAQPSNRTCYQVRPIEEQKQKQYGKSTPKEDKKPCFCFSNKYCTCTDFETNVITNKTSLTVAYPIFLSNVLLLFIIIFF